MRITILFLLTAIELFGQTKYSIEESPKWIKYNPVDTSYDKRDGELTFLLEDEQHNVEDKIVYNHIAYKILNQKGLQSALPITINFDPLYQKLIFHQVNIIRNGVSLKQDIKKITQVFRRENQAEKYLINGLLTAYINISDIKTDDIIEVEYSVKGSNPILGSKYSEILALSFSKEVHQLRKRFLYSTSRNINYKISTDEIVPKTKVENNLNVLEINLNDTKAVVEEENTPAWINVYDMMSITEYKNWSEVVDWAHNTLLVNQKIGSATKGIHDSLNYSQKGKYTYLLKTVQYVQDNIRYLSEAGGIYSHRPKSPEEVIISGYGDCKDKSILLCKLLELEGIEAYPVLVNANIRQGIKDYLPNTNVFNHCIVMVKMDKYTFWFDPTYAYQRGNLQSRYMTNYNLGLVVKKGNNQLNAIGESNYSEIETYYSFELMEYASFANLYIRNYYKGFEADIIRNFVNSNTHDQIDKYFLDYRSKYYPAIEKILSVKYEDDEKNNQITLTENYRVNNIWVFQKEKDSSSLAAQFFAARIFDNLLVPTQSKRTQPFWIYNYPTKIKESFYIHLPSQFAIENETKNIYDNILDYSFEVNKDEKGDIHIEYRYSPFKNSIDTSEFKLYQKHVDFIQNSSIYNIKFFNTGTYTFNYFQAIIAFLGILITAIILIFLNTIVNPKSSFNTQEEVDFNIYYIIAYKYLLISLLAIRVISILILDADIMYSFLDKNSVNFFPLKFIAITFETFVSGILLSYIIYNLILFHQRRTSFLIHSKVLLIISGVATLLSLLSLYLYEYISLVYLFLSSASVIGIHTLATIYIFTFHDDNPFFNKYLTKGIDLNKN